MSEQRIEILLVEDNPDDAELLRELLEGASLECTVTHVDRARAAVAHLRTGTADVVLLDLSLPDSRGLATFALLQGVAAHIPVIVTTGLDDEALAISAVQQGAQDYLVKGEFTGGLLTRAIRYAIERKRLERELLQISEGERRRIGQDMHDGLCNHLAGVAFKAELLEEKLTAEYPAEAPAAGRIAGMVKKAVEQARALARGLNPIDLDAGGLTSALQELATHTEAVFGTPCTFQCAQSVAISDVAVGTHLFRIAQEAVHNAVKHGHATRISIDLTADTLSVILAVRDDGDGFAMDNTPPTGMGLRIMRYRAGMINGSLDIRPNAPRGVVVSCTVRQPAAAPERS